MPSISPAPSPPALDWGRRVLIVEDELLIAWQLESLVRDQKLDVCAMVPDGDGAIEQAGEVDLILMDVRLAGGMDGIEAARRIRAHHDTPIIFVTAHGDPKTRDAIEKAMPGTPVLAKPITSERLCEAIAAVMPRQS